MRKSGFRFPFSFLAPVLALTATTLLARPARADFHADEDLGANAYTLPKGQVSLGITRPLAVGITDDLELDTHPIFDLLGLVNAEARLSLAHGAWGAIALEGAGLNTVQLFDGEPVLRVFGGDLALDLNVTPALRVGFSAGAAYATVIDAKGIDGQSTAELQQTVAVSSGLLGGGHVDLALGRADRLSFGFSATAPTGGDANVKVAGLAENAVRWNADLLYGHAWGNFRLEAGLTTGNELRAQGTDAYPIADLWWRW